MILFPILSILVILYYFYLMKNTTISWLPFSFVTLLIVCIGCGPIPSLLINNLQYQYKDNLLFSELKEENIIILLGNGTTTIKENPIIKVDPSPQSYSRIFETIRLYRLCKQNRKNCTIIISGGDPQKHGISEADVYGEKLLEVGIDKKDIKLETKSLNTFQNAKLSLPIIKSIMGDKSKTNIILVSSAYHLQRSQLYFKNLGINTIASRADYINVKYSFIPSIINFNITAIALKEYLGIGIWFSNIMS
ncbi:YdcF family protein [Candidatus Liberibacter americanus]|nr:YdcF family protein [Candidatus Liberibacter americanus]EMS36046.1 hypothetical protein G653_03596 [Candidatus Liberibacter americanus PW_SP]